jgi:hypothetical protein
VSETSFTELALRAWPEVEARRLTPRAELAKVESVLAVAAITSPDTAQRLVALAWALEVDGIAVEEGLAFPDGATETEARLRAYAAGQEPHVMPGLGRLGEGRTLRVLPVSAWLDERLYEWAARRRATTIGAALPVTLSRIAAYWARAKGSFRDGWSFAFWGAYDGSGHWHDRDRHPRLRAKRVGSDVTLLDWSGTDRRDRRGSRRRAAGSIVDVTTLAGALCGRPVDLDDGCRAFGLDAPRLAAQRGTPTLERLDALRTTVTRVLDLYRAERAELGRHVGLVLDPARLHSTAGVADALFRLTGVTPPVTKYADVLSAERLGPWMAAVHGSWIEAPLAGHRLPVVPVDRSQMFLTCAVLLGGWQFLAAERLTEVDVTDELLALLADPALRQRLYDAATWRQFGLTLDEVRPRGEPLIHRSRGHQGEWQTVIGPLEYDGRFFLAWPDVAAATVMGGRPPEIVGASKLEPSGLQPGLTSIALRGGRLVAPGDDLFAAIGAERQRAATDATLPDHERMRLRGFWKLLGNSLVFGLPLRFDRERLARPRRVTIHGPDGAIARRVQWTETPGPWNCPPLAATVCAGARIFLALLIAEVRDCGGSIAALDTDAALICATRDGGETFGTDRASRTIRALSFTQVRKILGRFAQLRPFAGSDWRIEHDAIARPTVGLMHGPKRYSLQRTDTGELVKGTEHVLGGVYVDPTAEDSEDEARTADGRRAWVAEVHRALIAAGESRPVLPDWTALPAVSRLGYERHDQTAWFEAYNSAHPRDEQIRPFTSVLRGHTDPLASAPDVIALTADDRPLSAWADGPWWDGRTGAPIRVTTRRRDGADPRHHLRTLASVIARWCAPQRAPGAPTITAGSSELTAWLGKDGDLLTAAGRGEAIERTDWLTVWRSPTSGPDARRGLCTGCGTRLSRRQRRWCSSRCRMRVARVGASLARPPKTAKPGEAKARAAATARACAHCGAIFLTRSSVRRSCSARCRKAASRARQTVPACLLCGGPLDRVDQELCAACRAAGFSIEERPA